MSPNLTVGYLADEAAVTRTRAPAAARLPASLGAALVRLAARLSGTARPVDTAAASAALPAR